MFSLLNPAALLALLGLLVPVAIHLWNRKPGREVAVGSVRWLAAGANRRLRNLKPEQLWLLGLRLLLLTVLVGALAGPEWRQALPASRGQVLVSPELLGTPALAALRPRIASLRRQGYALRWLAAGLPKVAEAAWQADSLGPQDETNRPTPAAPAAATATTAGFWWARVRQAAKQFAGQPLYIITPATLRGLRGAHEPLRAGITWQMLPVATSKTWLQAAAVQADSLVLVLGLSSETQTTFRRVTVGRPRLGGLVRVADLPPLRLVAGTGAGNGSWLQPLSEALTTTLPAAPNSAEPPGPRVPVRTQPLRVALHATAAYAPDARCLQAALRAASMGLALPLVLHKTTQPPRPASPSAAPVAAQADWLFWLSDEPLPAAWHQAVQHGAQVWQEAPGPGRADTAYLATSTAETLVTVFRRGAPASVATGSPLWADGPGRAVLTRQVLGQGAFYQLYTRLNPAWSDLADSPALPARLLALLQPDPTDEAAPAHAPSTTELALAALDQRALDPAQLRPSNLAGAAPSLPSAARQPPAFRQLDLRPWLVLLAGLLFAVERLLARRREASPVTRFHHLTDK